MSENPDKQRKNRFEAPFHERQDHVSSKLSKKLKNKYGKRRINLRTGDEVEVMRGDHKGTTGEVEEIDLTSAQVTVSNVEVEKSDGSNVRFPLRPSNLKIISLDTSDPERMKKLEAK